MDVEADLGILSLLPVVLALILAFRTKDAVFSLLVGCAAGVVLAGYDPATGLATLFQTALGNRDFIWVMMIEVAVGVLIALYLHGAHRSAGGLDQLTAGSPKRPGPIPTLYCEALPRVAKTT